MGCRQTQILHHLQKRNVLLRMVRVLVAHRTAKTRLSERQAGFQEGEVRGDLLSLDWAAADMPDTLLPKTNQQTYQVVEHAKQSLAVPVVLSSSWWYSWQLHP